MMYLHAISYWTPETFSLKEQCDEIGVSKLQAKLFASYFKLEQIPIAKSDLLKDMLSKSYGHFLQQEREQRDALWCSHQIKYVGYSHTVQGLVPFGENVLKEFLYERNLNHINYFGSSVNKCASNFSVMEMLSAQLSEDANPHAKALLVSADKAFNTETRVLPNASIAGDAASVCLFSKEKEGALGEIVDIKSHLFGEFSKGGWGDPKEHLVFEQKFTSIVSDVILNLLQENHVSLDDVDRILPHNVNVPIWLKIADHLKFPKEKIWMQNIPKYSHCFTSDFAMNLFTYMNHTHSNKKRELIVGVSIGYGLSVNVLLFRREGVLP
jgi:3-oxoacyl-[acyl-carrier-protein] synthase-3